mmetsp:Transcript_22040/g.40430  ORF Transcript_22040/g.40430 Transcript_22040/m.40430 type:complete len:173 (-) Transcript_22040:501-1019(-)
MSDLIVNFPQQRCNSSVGKSAKKTVQFAPMNELRFFERNEKMNRGKFWYSDKEYKAMKTVTQQGKRYLSLSSNQVDNADALDDCIVTGIENLLSPNIIRTPAMTNPMTNLFCSRFRTRTNSNIGDPNPFCSTFRTRMKTPIIPNPLTNPFSNLEAQRATRRVQSHVQTCSIL